MIKNNRGSILIWSLFFMVFISFSFLYMSSDVLKIIKDSDFVKGQSLSYINRNKEITGVNVDIGNGDLMNLYFVNSFSGALRQKEITNFSFLSNNTGALNITSGGPIYFKTFSGATIYDSGMIYTSKTISLSGSLSLENFGGFTNYSMNFTSSNGIVLPYNYYKIEKTIGGTNILKEFGFYNDTLKNSTETISVGNSCNSTQPTNATLTTGSPTSSNQAWQTSDSSGACHFVCNSGYGYNGTSCISATNCATGLQYITLSNGQSWSCMNLGATTVRDGSTQPTNCGGSSSNCNSSLTWIGDYYQWGRNDTGFTLGQAGWNNDWQTPQVNSAWGGSSSDTATSDAAGTTKVGRKGPCATGWHVPSAKDWQDMCNNVLGTTCSNGMAYDSRISSILRLPFAGRRYRDYGYYYYQSSIATYWSSSPNTPDSYHLFFYTSGIRPTNGFSRAYGFSVRCIKN